MSNSLSSMKIRYILGVVASLILSVAVLSSFSSPSGSLFNQGRLVASDRAYLQHIETADRTNLLLLSEMRAFLYVLQSSNVGISFIVDANVSVGQALAPLTDIADKAFEVTLASLTAISLLGDLLDLSKHLAAYLALAFSLCFGLYCLLALAGNRLTGFTAVFSRLSRMLLLLFFSLHLLIPYSIHGAAIVNEVLLKEQQNLKNENLKNLHEAMVDQRKPSDLKEKVKTDIGHLEKMLIDVPHKTEAMVSYHVEHFSLSLISHLIVPLTLFALLFWLMSRIVLPAMVKGYRLYGSSANHESLFV